MASIEHIPRTPHASRSTQLVSRIKRLAIELLACILIAYLSISAIAAHMLTIPHRQQVFQIAGEWKYRTSPQEVGLAYENVSFPAREDGVRIAAWFIPGGERAIIVVHGKDSCRPCEFSNRALHFAKAMHARGFSLLQIDLRGHGESGEGRFTFGLRERRDILGAVDWLTARGFKPGSIGLLGVSMGAASSIGAAAEEPAIGALATDSAYAEIYPILRREFRNGSGLPGFLLPSTMWMGRFVTGENVAAARPVDEIGRIEPRPVLVIHASGDQLIPAADAERLAVATPGAELWIVPAPNHAQAYAYDPAAYVERVARFFQAGLR